MDDQQSAPLERIAKALERLANAQEALVLVEAAKVAKTIEQMRPVQAQLDIRLAVLQAQWPLAPDEVETLLIAHRHVTALLSEHGNVADGSADGAGASGDGTVAADTEQNTTHGEAAVHLRAHADGSAGTDSHAA